MAIDPFTIARLGLGGVQLARGLSSMRDRQEDQRGQERIRRLLQQAQATNLRQGQAIAGSGAGISPALAQRAALQSVSEANQAATASAMDQEAALALADRERTDRLVGAELGALGAFGGQVLTALQGEEGAGGGIDKEADIDMARQIEAKRNRAAQAATAAGEAAPAATVASEAAGSATPSPATPPAAAGASQEGDSEELLTQFLGGSLTPAQMAALEQQYAPVQQPEDMSIEGLGFRPAPIRTDSTSAFSPGDPNMVDAVGRVQVGEQYAPQTSTEQARRAARVQDIQAQNAAIAGIGGGFGDRTALEQLGKDMFGEPPPAQELPPRVGDPTVGISREELTSQLGSQLRQSTNVANPTPVRRAQQEAAFASDPRNGVMSGAMPGPTPTPGNIGYTDHGPGILNTSNILPEGDVGGVFGASGGVPQAFLDAAPPVGMEWDRIAQKRDRSLDYDAPPIPGVDYEDPSIPGVQSQSVTPGSRPGSSTQVRPPAAPPAAPAPADPMMTPPPAMSFDPSASAAQPQVGVPAGIDRGGSFSLDRGAGLLSAPQVPQAVQAPQVAPTAQPAPQAESNRSRTNRLMRGRFSHQRGEDERQQRISRQFAQLSGNGTRRPIVSREILDLDEQIGGFVIENMDSLARNDARAHSQLRGMLSAAGSDNPEHDAFRIRVNITSARRP